MRCNTCGAVDTFYFHYETKDVNYKEIEVQLPLFFVRCSECGTEEYNDNQAEHINKVLLDNFKSAVDNYKEERGYEYKHTYYSETENSCTQYK